MINATQSIRLTKSELERLEDWLSTLPHGEWDSVVIAEGKPSGIGSSIVAYVTIPGKGQGWFKEISDINEW